MNTLSNQDFAGLDKFRLRVSLRKIKEMRVMNRTKKGSRNESCTSDLYNSPFSPAMANLAAGSSAWETTSLACEKWDHLESMLLTTSSEKNSSLQGTASLLNQCIGEENQDWL